MSARDEAHYIRFSYDPRYPSFGVLRLDAALSNDPESGGESGVEPPHSKVILESWNSAGWALNRRSPLFNGFPLWFAFRLLGRESAARGKRRFNRADSASNGRAGRREQFYFIPEGFVLRADPEAD